MWVKENVAIPPFHPDDVTLLFADTDMPVGLFVNHNDPTECFASFHSDECIIKVLKLAGTTGWMGTHNDLKLSRSRAEMLLIIENVYRLKGTVSCTPE